MADAYLAADLIIGRSGAVTCSEFRALGRYALFVPLPIGNGEQFVNAASLVADGRAEVISQTEFTPDYISTHLVGLLEKASQAPIQGDPQDLLAAEKIVALDRVCIEAMKPQLSSLIGKRIHFIGIGGAGMSGLARIALSHGISVSGSDAKDSSVVTALSALGAKVSTSHAAENVDGSDLVVYSNAISLQQILNASVHRS